MVLGTMELNDNQNTRYEARYIRVSGQVGSSGQGRPVEVGFLARASNNFIFSTIQHNNFQTQLQLLNSQYLNNINNIKRILFTRPLFTHQHITPP